VYLSVCLLWATMPEIKWFDLIIYVRLHTAISCSCH